jgi:signal transduction histidine kinase
MGRRFIALGWLAWVLLVPAMQSAAIDGAGLRIAGPQLVTNTTQIRVFSRMQAYQGWPLRLDGIATLVDSSRGIMVVQDSSGAQAIQFPLHVASVRPGQRIRLESDFAAVQGIGYTQFPLHPSSQAWLASFSAPTNVGNAYLARFHGYLRPPATGEYRFWIASKGASELWLGNGTPAGEVGRIAYVPSGGATRPLQWGKYPSQTSAVIHLEAGEQYLIDVLHEHHAGIGDTVAVSWAGPGIEEQSIIDGRYLTPYTNHQTNGIIREQWGEYLPMSVESLTGGRNERGVVEALAPRVKVLEDGGFPEPLAVGIGEAFQPANEYRWVRIEGTVRSLALSQEILSLELQDGAARCDVRVLGWDRPWPVHLQGARLAVRGICESVVDSTGNRTVGLVSVPSPAELSQVEPFKGSTYDVIPVTMGELNPANPKLAGWRRIRVRGTVGRINEDGVILQGKGSYTGFVSTNGVNWMPVSPPADIPMSNSALAGLCVFSGSSAALVESQFELVRGIRPGGEDLEIGGEAEPGTTVSQGQGRFLVKGGGMGFGQSVERFHFYCHPLTNAEIVARLTALENASALAGAGIMIRASSNSAVNFVSLTVNGNGGVAFRYRQGQQERGAVVSIPGLNVPCWLKLKQSFPEIEARLDERDGFEVGDEVEVAGWLQWRDGTPVLIQASRLSPDGIEAELSSKILDGASSAFGAVPRVSIAQVIPKEGEGLAEGSGFLSVRGVVTYSGPAFGSNYLILQDETAGASVLVTPRLQRGQPEVGSLIEMQLRSRNGKWPLPFEPYRIEVLGRARLPEPIPFPPEYGTMGPRENSWGECQGIVREVVSGSEIALMCKEGPVRVWIGDSTPQQLSRWVDASVRIRGVALRLGAQPALLVPSANHLEVLEPEATEPFAIPAIPIVDLKAFNRLSAVFHRVKVHGVVTYKGDNLLVVQDESAAIRVRCRVSPDLVVGDLVEVVGFPDMQSGFPVLSQSLVRKMGDNQRLAPVVSSLGELESGNMSARLIRVSGEVVRQQSERGYQVLELRDQQRIFRATLAPNLGTLPGISSGSLVNVIGVCWDERVGRRLPDGAGNEPMSAAFEVLLRTPGDVEIVQKPSWWTWKHAMIVVGCLGAILAVSMLWIGLLRRKVIRRTQELNAAMSKLEQETKTSATLAERNRLAGEIHDGLEQGLSAIMMQLDGLESKLGNNPSEVSRHLELARNMVRFSRTEVRYSLWDWQSPALAKQDLHGALSEIVRQMSARTSVQLTMEISGERHPLPTVIEHHLLRIAQESLNNALKYADARTIRLKLDYSAEDLRLSVQDDGRGFSPETVLDAGDSHFGLQNLRSRARKFGGRLVVTSSPGKGTLIEVIVPLSVIDSKLKMQARMPVRHEAFP